MSYRFVEQHIVVDPISLEADVGCLVIMEQHWTFVRERIEPWLLKEFGYEKWWPTQDRMAPLQNYAFKFRSHDDATVFILRWCS